MDRDSTNTIKLSQGNGLYYAPIYSPDDNKIGFNKFLNNRYYLGFFNADGSKETLLANNITKEAVSWSPNSKSLAFSRKAMNKMSYLYTIDINGYNDKLIYSDAHILQFHWCNIYD